jgi:hypothetical protein
MPRINQQKSNLTEGEKVHGRKEENNEERKEVHEAERHENRKEQRLNKVSETRCRHCDSDIIALKRSCRHPAPPLQCLICVLLGSF